MQLSPSTSSTVMTWLPSSNLSKQRARPAHHCRDEQVPGDATLQLALTKTKKQRKSMELRNSLQRHRSKAAASRTTVCSAIRPKANSHRRNSASRRLALILARSLPYQLDRESQVSLLDTASASRKFSRLSLKQSTRTLRTPPSTCLFLNFLRWSTVKQGDTQLHQQTPQIGRLMTLRRSIAIRLTFNTRQRSQNTRWSALTAAKSSLDLMKSKRLG